MKRFLFTVVCLFFLSAVARTEDASAVAKQQAEEIRKLREENARLRKKLDVLLKQLRTLEPLRQEYEARRRLKEEVKEFGQNPGPIPPTGQAVKADTKLTVGQDLLVSSGGSWYGSRILKLHENGTVRIHYLGWSDSYDVDVPRSRLQLDPDVAKKMKKHARDPFGQRIEVLGFRNLEVPRAAKGKDLDKVIAIIGAIEPAQAAVEPSGRKVTKATRLKPEDSVLIESGGLWWEGSVVRVNDDGTVRVTYTGYEEHFDENVPRSRLQLPKPDDVKASEDTSPKRDEKPDAK